MTLDQARSVLMSNAGMGDLLMAIGAIISDRSSSLSDLILGLPHSELIAEQAAIALYRRTGRPRPAESADLVTDPEDWIVWLLENTKAEPAERLRTLLAATAAAAARINPQVATKLAPVINAAAR